MYVKSGSYTCENAGAAEASGQIEMATTKVETDAAATGNRTRIQSVARASQILLWIATQTHGATAKEIAASQGLALPTAYHLLNTLVDEGFLAKDANRRYVFGRSSAILAQAYLRGKTVPESLLNVLRDIAHRTGETAYLADWGENGIRVLASVEGKQMVRVAEVGGGAYEHGHARANGKVLLAHVSPEIRQGYLRAHPLVPVTENTIWHPDAFERELAEIRERGYAYDDEEFAAGVSCVAAPILQDGQLIAAMGLSVPTERMNAKRAELTSALLNVVSAVEREPAD